MWKYRNKKFDKQPDEKFVGCVYEILEVSTGLKYIGIKRFWKGKKKKNKKESDWRTYNTSNRILKEKIPKNPKDYKKKILHLCETQTMLRLLEAKIQMDYYFKGRWNELYNEYIGFRLRIRKEKK